MPPLLDELVEEIFLRLPPDEPAALVRASLASKAWLSVLTGPAFRGRYREFHGAPPMLGFLYNRTGRVYRRHDPAPCFASTTKFGVRLPHFTQVRHQNSYPWDCRHGRVLLVHASIPTKLVVWDPMTGYAQELSGADSYKMADMFRVAVLCAVSGCDHRACHAAPFKVVSVGLKYSEEGERVAPVARVWSSETGDWSKPRPGLDLVAAADAFIQPMPSVLVNDALHFLLGYKDDDDRVEILKYSLSSDSLSLIDAPNAEFVVVRAGILMALKDGSLGFAHVDRLTIYVWSRQIGSDGVASWSHRIVMDLKNLIPIKTPKKTARLLIGSVEGGDIIFMNTDLGIYEIDLKTLEWKERWKGKYSRALIPYMSFYNPPGEYDALLLNQMHSALREFRDSSPTQPNPHNREA